jgi:hypothetical protein
MYYPLQYFQNKKKKKQNKKIAPRNMNISYI